MTKHQMRRLIVLLESQGNFVRAEKLRKKLERLK